MRLVKAQIENFRCINDSTEIEIGDVTCLVGKNEAGKTALLQALNKLNPLDNADAAFERERDYPRRFLHEYDDRHPNGDAPAIRTVWTLDDEDRAAVDEVVGPGALKTREIVIRKGYKGEQTWTLEVDERLAVSHLLSSSDLHAEEAEAAKGCATVKALKSHIEGLGANATERHKALKGTLDSSFKRGTAVTAAIDVLAPRMPKFIYFGQYDRMSGQVSLDQLILNVTNKNLPEGERVFLAFLGLVGVTPEELRDIKKFETLNAKLEAVSITISKAIFEYWSQNRQLDVQFRLDQGKPGDLPPFHQGPILRTRIFNRLHQVSVPFDDRSTGFVWFFSFLVLFSQVKRTHGDRIIVLLDEPGLSLHAKAQADLLRYFAEKLKPKHQLIYTTHSPFMVPPDDLMSARTVEDVVIQQDGKPDEVLGTKVSGETLSKDRDTLFPLQAALGYEITQTLFVGKNTLLVEGPSDLLYLKAFSEELRSRGRTPLDVKWVISPAGGIDKVPAFMALFGGNRLNVAVFVDLASGQKKKVEELRRLKLLHDNRILTADAYAGQTEADIEDLLGAQMYPALVNDAYALTDTNRVPAPQPGATTRILKHAEAHFRTLPPAIAEFDHFRPADYLVQNRVARFQSLPDVDTALDRFEKLIKDINALTA